MAEAQPAAAGPPEGAPAASGARRDADSPKYQAIMDAARDVILEQGFGASSVDAIARRAGVSKATLYAYFTSKAELFGAMIERACRTNFARLFADDLDHDDVARGLTQIARDFAAVLLTPSSLAVNRVVMAEAVRFPELGRAYYEAGPALIIGAVTDYLMAANAAGKLSVPEPRLAAEQFYGMIRSDLYMRMILRIEGGAGTQSAEAAADGAVRTFLAAFAPRTPAA
jgi:TetR/AcrR family transcriptional repressor of mexJK operon